MSRRMSRRAEALAAQAQRPPVGTFVCWVPGCDTYGVPQPLPPNYVPGAHYARYHHASKPGKPGTPVVEWEARTGRSLMEDTRA